MNTLRATAPSASEAFLLWIGRILAALVVVALLADAGVNLLAPHLMAGAMQETGFPVDLSPAIGTLALVAALLYAIPRTQVLGAILVTGFLGGAICAHFRLGDMGSPPQIVSLLLGAAAWASLVLRLPAMRGLLPWTTRA